MILLPLDKLEIHNCPPNFIDTILCKSSNSNFWSLKVSRKSPYIFKTININNKYLLCIKANHNFIISGNILLIYYNEKTKINVWFVGNIFVLLSFFILIIQFTLIGKLMYSYMIDNSLNVIETLKSKYFEKYILSYLQLLLMYIYLYFMFIARNITYWKKTFSTLLNGK